VKLYKIYALWYVVIHTTCHIYSLLDLYSGEKLYTYMSLKSRLAQLILNALTFEKDSSNSNMLLGKYPSYSLYTAGALSKSSLVERRCVLSTGALSISSLVEGK